MQNDLFNTRDNLDPRRPEGTLEGGNLVLQASSGKMTPTRRQLELEFKRRLDAYEKFRAQYNQVTDGGEKEIQVLRQLRQARSVLEQAEQLLRVEPRRLYQFHITIDDSNSEMSVPLIMFISHVITMTVNMVSKPDRIPIIPDLVSEVCYEVHQQSVYLYGREPSSSIEWARFLMLVIYYLELKQLGQLSKSSDIRQEIYHIEVDDADELTDDSRIANLSL